MNAKRDDLSRLQEIHDIILQTKRQLRALEFTRSRFCDPDNDEDRRRHHESRAACH